MTEIWQQLVLNHYPMPLWVLVKMILIYALPWEFAFEGSNLLVHNQGYWSINFPGETALEHSRDILLYALSLIAGGFFWAFSYILIIAALHQGALAWLSRRLALPKTGRFAGHLAFGVLTGMVLFYFFKSPGHLSWAGFEYYTPPLAFPGFISCVFASGCAGVYSSRQRV